jgi:hypothetical protein
MDGTGEVEPSRAGWHVPLSNVLAGMLAQAALLVVLAIGAIALLRATNPGEPRRDAGSHPSPGSSWR